MRTPTYTLGPANLLRLPPGEDLLVGLYRSCRESGIEMGVFWATGTVRSATLGHLDPERGELSRQVPEGSHDLVQCSGNISLQDDSLHLHAYAVLGDRDGHVSAGELLAAEVYVVEVLLVQLKGKPLTRVLDPETGFWLWPLS